MLNNKRILAVVHIIVGLLLIINAVSCYLESKIFKFIISLGLGILFILMELSSIESNNIS